MLDLKGIPLRASLLSLLHSPQCCSTDLIVWVCLDALGMSALYCLMFLCNKLQSLTSHKSAILSWQTELLNGTASFLCYPIVYIFLTLPLSITRLNQINNQPDFGETIEFLAATMYTSGGVCNVLLYTAERRGIISFRWRAWFQSPARRLSFYLPERQESKMVERSGLV